jgi:hypothetical protein
LIAALIILAAAALLGTALAVTHLRTQGAAAPSWALAALHGLLAISGLGCLALALRGPPRGLDQGTAPFGIIAITMMMLAALPGVGLLAARIRKRRIAGIIIGIHATVAVSGLAVLAAYVFAG